MVRGYLTTFPQLLAGSPTEKAVGSHITFLLFLLRQLLRFTPSASVTALLSRVYASGANLSPDAHTRDSLHLLNFCTPLLHLLLSLSDAPLASFSSVKLQRLLLVAVKRTTLLLLRIGREKDLNEEAEKSRMAKVWESFPLPEL
jgi:hypothetical protein